MFYSKEFLLLKYQNRLALLSARGAAENAAIINKLQRRIRKLTSDKST